MYTADPKMYYNKFLLTTASKCMLITLWRANISMQCRDYPPTNKTLHGFCNLFAVRFGSHFHPLCPRGQRGPLASWAHTPGELRDHIVLSLCVKWGKMMTKLAQIRNCHNVKGQLFPSNMKKKQRQNWKVFTHFGFHKQDKLVHFERKYDVTMILY